MNFQVCQGHGYHKRAADGYGYAPKCTYVYVPNCVKVPIKTPHTSYVPKCTPVPKTNCVDTYKKVQEEVCIDVPSQVCKDIPKKVIFLRDLENLQNIDIFYPTSSN